jgi:hypothetical protein
MCQPLGLYNRSGRANLRAEHTARALRSVDTRFIVFIHKCRAAEFPDAFLASNALFPLYNGSFCRFPKRNAGRPENNRFDSRQIRCSPDHLNRFLQF